MRRRWVAVVAPLVVLAACGGSGAPPGTTVSTATGTTVTRASTPSTTPTPARPSTTTMIRATPTTTAPPSTSPPTTTAPLPAPPTGDQLVVVTTSAYGSSTATLTAYEHTDPGWVPRFGPWPARIGRNGFAPPGQKREGDGRTPSGTYGFSFFFGIEPNPGVTYAYRRIDSTALVWDDDPQSANYNEWIDTRVASGGVHPEPMYDAPFYDYGAVIAYNTARTPGLGSAIFLHVSNGGSTAGCVALPVAQLLQVLRWLTPTRNPHVRMGVNAPRP